MEHHCTKAQRNENVVDTCRTFSTEGKKRVAAKLLNEIRQEESVDRRSGELNLPSGSKTLIVNFGRKKKPRMLSIDDMIKIRNTENLTNEQIYGVASAIRFGLQSRNCIESGLSQALPQLKWKIEEFFTVEVINFTKKDGKVETFITHPLFFCQDLKSFILYIANKRGLNLDNLDLESLLDNLELICQIDDGQSMLKVIIR